MVSRRHFMIAAGGATLLSSAGIFTTKSAASTADSLETVLASIERRSKGRLGVAVRETGSGIQISWRGDERFPMCSTFKFLLAAAILQAVDLGEENLSRMVSVKAGDIIAHSPVSRDFVGREASVEQLCEATMTVSDNAAANLLLPAVGGPRGLTRFARGIGDDTTRLDRTEPGLNEARPGDERDTTSPNAMLATLDRLVLGSALSKASRETLRGWLVANKTGDARLRAGVPRDWIVGDKTGTGSRGTANDIGIFWPADAAPIVVTSYLTQSPLDADGKNAIHAEVGRAVAAAVAT